MSNAADALRAVADAGYAGVELFDHSGAPGLAQLGPHITANGLAVIGAHIVLDTINNDALMHTMAADYARAGASHLALAYLWPQQRGGLAVYQAIAKQLNHAAKITQSHGVTLSYHNHDFEFALLEDGRTAFDVLMDETDPALVKAELDLFWVQKAGLDPVAVLNRYAGRISLAHVKDMTKTDERTFEIVGEGCMDFGAILPAAERAGAAWFIVEQDVCPQGEIPSMQRSYKNIVARGWT